MVKRKSLSTGAPAESVCRDLPVTPFIMAKRWSDSSFCLNLNRLCHSTLKISSVSATSISLIYPESLNIGFERERWWAIPSYKLGQLRTSQVNRIPVIRSQRYFRFLAALSADLKSLQLISIIWSTVKARSISIAKTWLRFFSMTEVVLEFITLIFQRVECFVLNFPTWSASLHYCKYIFLG